MSINSKDKEYYIYFLHKAEVLLPVLLVKKRGTFKFHLISIQRRLQSIFMSDVFLSHFYEIFDDGKVVGVVWITSVNKYRMIFMPSSHFEVTIIINKAERNKGFGARAIDALCSKHLNLVALVRTENLISAHLFNKISEKYKYTISKSNGILGSRYKLIEQKESSE